MFAGFITALRNEGVPVSMTEYLTLLGAMQAGVVQLDVEDFYYPGASQLVKKEQIDRFDRRLQPLFPRSRRSRRRIRRIFRKSG